MVTAFWFLGDLGWVWIALVILLAVIGAGTLLFFAFEAYDDWQLSRSASSAFRFDPAPFEKGMPILDYANEEVLRSLASQHGLEQPPAKVERRKSRGLKGGSKHLQGTTSSDTTETHEPRDDLAKLLKALLRHLHKEGELDQSGDCVQAGVAEPGVSPFLASEEFAREYFADWLNEQYPTGLAQVEVEDLADALAAAGRSTPEQQIREHLTETFSGLRGSSHILFLEGEWSIEEDGEHQILLSRRDLRITYPGGEEGGSVAMPDGVAITAQLDTQALTTHGRNRMVGVTQPIRAAIVATFRQHEDEETSCLSVAPIAVFQTVR